MPKISELPLANKLKEEDYIPIVQDGVTKKVKGTHFVTEEEYSLDAFSPTIAANDKTMYKFGEGDTVDFSDSAYDGAYKSAILKGKTLANTVKGNVRVSNRSTNVISVTPTDKSKKYLLKFRINKIATVLKESDTQMAVKLQFFSGSNPKGFHAISNKNFNVGFEETIVVEPLASGDETNFIIWMPRYESGELDIDILFIEYQEGMENWDIPYFEGMQSVRMPVLTTTGKNLWSYGELGEFDIKVIENVTIEPGAYWFSGTQSVTYDSPVTIALANADGTVVKSGYFNTQFDVYETVKKVIIYSNGYSYGNSTGNFLTVTNFMMEKDTITDTYEPYKSSILSTLEPVELGSVGDVQDTFDLLTGDLTKRVYKIVFDESFKDRNVTVDEFENVYRFGVNADHISNNLSNDYVMKSMCDKFSVDTNYTGDYEHSYYWGAKFYFFISKNKLQGTANSFKTYITDNPITFQTICAEPVHKTVDLKVVDQNGNVIPTLKSWNTTTHIYSEIPENSLYPILSHSNPTYPVILKPSTKYSIVTNSYSNDHTNSAINFNLGGATASTTVGNRVTTITTPSTLSNELLTMSGRGNKLNNVMVIEGDVAGDEPYFEGICDVKSPILSNVGKNLVNPNNYINYPNNNVSVKKDGEHSYILENKTTGNWRYQIGDKVKLKANTTYTLSYDYELLSESVPMNYGAVINLRDESNPNKNISGDAVKGKPRTFTTTEDVIVQLAMYITDTSGGINKIKYYNIQVVEAPTVLDYEPYKSNILSCNGDKIELTEDMFEQGGTIATVGVLYQNNKESNNTRLRLKDILEVAPNTTYRLKLAHGYEGYVQTYNREKLSTSNRLAWNNDIVFTTANNEQYVVVAIRNSSNSSISTSVLTSNIVTLSEVDKTIVLRSLPKGVCDTLNIETGEYVQRIGEVVINGVNSEYDYVDNTGLTNHTRYRFQKAGLNVKYIPVAQQSYNVEGLPNVATPWNSELEGVQADMTEDEGANWLWVRVANSRLSSPDKTGVLEWLSQNPITVQYELETPIVSTIDIQGFPYAYKDGHVQLSSGSIEQSLTPKVEYNIATNRGGQITQNTKSLIRQGKLLNDIESKINQIIEATVNDSIMLMKLRNK